MERSTKVKPMNRYADIN